MTTVWKATCMQTICHPVNDAGNRDDAMAIVARSLDRWEARLRGAAARKADIPQLFLFPEFNLQGFPLGEDAATWIAKACLRIPGSPEIERLQKLADELKIYIGANAYEAPDEWPGRYFNCSFLIDPAGEIVLKYRRVSTAEGTSPHDLLHAYLDKHGLDGLWPVADTALGKIAMMPCGEILWPETARCFALRGAEVILHPTSDHGMSDHLAWESAKKVRAAENMVYFISANAGGIDGGVLPQASNVGNSKIIDFQGRVIAENLAPGESARTAAPIDMDALRRARTTAGNLYGVNRLARLRVEAYRPVYEAASFYPPNLYADTPMQSKKQVGATLRQVMDTQLYEGSLKATAHKG